MDTTKHTRITNISKDNQSLDGTASSSAAFFKCCGAARQFKRSRWMLASILERHSCLLKLLDVLDQEGLIFCIYIDRIASGKLLRLANAFPAVVISGARQVGKSTLVEHLFKEKADIVVFDPVIDIENARQDPEFFLNNHRTPIVLDEIQYAPELIPAIKRRIDKDRSPGQYIITGSQQWGVLKSISESLSERAVFLDLESLSLSEISGKQDVKTLIPAWLDSPTDFLTAAPDRLPVNSTLYELLWRGSMPETRSS